MFRHAEGTAVLSRLAILMGIAGSGLLVLGPILPVQLVVSNPPGSDFVCVQGIGGYWILVPFLGIASLVLLLGRRWVWLPRVAGAVTLMLAESFLTTIDTNAIWRTGSFASGMSMSLGPGWVVIAVGSGLLILAGVAGGSCRRRVDREGERR